MRQETIPTQNPIQNSDLNISHTITFTFKAMTGNRPLAIALFSIYFVTEFLFFSIETNTEKSGFIIISTIFLEFLIGGFAQAALCYGIFFTLKNQIASVKDCLRTGMIKMIPVALTSFIVGIGVSLATVAFIIPGLIALTATIVAIPVCTVEGLSFIDSIKRSGYLTKDLRMNIFYILTIISIITIIIIIITIYTLDTMISDKISNHLILNSIVSLLKFYYYSLSVVIYFKLRSIKEGINLEKITNIFE